jgi:hypothetical protein
MTSPLSMLAESLIGLWQWLGLAVLVLIIVGYKVYQKRSME